jgi:putative two-component system response regulator
VHAETQLDRRSVTLVEDDACLRDVLSRAARAFHFEPRTAQSGEEAIAVLEQSLTPVVVTELRLPGRGGLWLVREIQRRWPEIAVIVLTGGVVADSVHACLAAGVHHFFLKPIHLDEFHHALESSWEAQVLRRRCLEQKRALETRVRRQTRELRRTVFSAVVSLVRTLEARDSYTSGHSRRVRSLSLRLATRMGLDERRRQQLSLAAGLHDIGKVGLAEGILTKPAPLDADELLLVRQHPVIGERILRPIIRSRTVLSAIRGHHERYDGQGYPDGLRGDRIPLLARIITVADCFDAISSARAYRSARPPREALELLMAGRGGQFDPELVPPFVAMMRSDSAELRRG